MASTRIISWLLSCCLFFLNTTAFARQKISGIISGQNNLPLAGATIIVKGTNIATTSLTDGSFIITAKPGDILEFSFIGYKTRQVKIGGSYQWMGY